MKVNLSLMISLKKILQHPNTNKKYQILKSARANLLPLIYNRPISTNNNK